MNDQHFVDAILRKDFIMFLRRCLMTLNPGQPFIDNWHIDAIAHQLKLVTDGKITRLIINMPPRNLKSLTVSVAFTAFLLGHAPSLRIFCVSYSDELAAKHAADFRAIVTSEWYRRAFPLMRIKRNVDNEVMTTARGFRKSTSVYGSLTGLGGDMFIIDDPQKALDTLYESNRNRLNQWVTNTLMSRLDSKDKGVIILVMQRLHLNDLSGHLMENSADWTVLSLPAIAEEDESIAVGDGATHIRRAGEALHPKFESLATLQKLRRDLGPDDFAAQYQQAPVPSGGGMIRRAWLRYYDVVPERTWKTRIILSWDTAAKNGAQNDWSVCTAWMLADNHYYLLDMVRGRYEYPQLREMAILLANKWKPYRILIEDASTGIALAQELQRAGTYATRAVPVERDKIGRVYVQQHKFEAGLVLFPKNTPFMVDVEAELLTFPQGKTDDIVDSITQALAHDMSGYDSTMGWVG